jgi:MtfA peptidase
MADWVPQFLGFAFILVYVFVRYFADEVLANQDWYVYRKLNSKTAYQKNVVKVVLEKYNLYFKPLSPKGKAKYIYRTIELTNSFDFIGKGGQKINTEIKVLIASVIAQTTFGWKIFDLDKFYEIHIYPDIFRLSPRLPKMQGASHPDGILVFSWKHILFGFADDSDGINVALHEIAHALKINYLDASSILPNKKYSDWNEHATRVKLDMQIQEETFFRKRAKTNMHEFFAICLENFFERPNEFLNHHPKLFAATCLLLNQNPLNTKSDYKT